MCKWMKGDGFGLWVEKMEERSIWIGVGKYYTWFQLCLTHENPLGKFHQDVKHYKEQKCVFEVDLLKRYPLLVISSLDNPITIVMSFFLFHFMAWFCFCHGLQITSQGQGIPRFYLGPLRGPSWKSRLDCGISSLNNFFLFFLKRLWFFFCLPIIFHLFFFLLFICFQFYLYLYW